MHSVYKHYTQAELNRQYNNRLQTPGFEKHLRQYEILSRKAEDELKYRKDIAYGSHPLETLDVFDAESKKGPVIVFIHGGYWRAFDKSSFSFVAPAFVGQGINVVNINYPLAPEVSLDKIFISCEKALRWVIQNFTGKIYLIGHSAGGHLAAELATTEVGIHIDSIVALSGLFNLEPIFYSEINSTLKLTLEMAIRNSPVNYQPVKSIPLLLAVGNEETDEFKNQTAELRCKWKNVESVEIQNANHFSIVELLNNRQSKLFLMINEFLGHQTKS